MWEYRTRSFTKKPFSANFDFPNLPRCEDPDTTASSLEVLATRYEHIEAGFRSIQKGLEALPSSPMTAQMIRDNLHCIASAAQNVRMAREAIERLKHQ